MSNGLKTGLVSSRQRVNTALNHNEPDRVPVDFLATPEIWNGLIESLDLESGNPGEGDYFDPGWEALLRMLEVDCRVISYDQFCQPPETALHKGDKVDWWGALSRSTPNRMWRRLTPEGDIYDIWGHHIRIVENPTGSYEENASWPLSTAQSVEELKTHPWPEPDWWDFSPLPEVLEQMNLHGQYHIRFRVGSVFEIAWQLRGMQEFLMDLAVNPGLPLYIMDRLTDVYVENTRRVIELAGERLDMVYFYDDVATQQSLMLSKKMWREHIRPRHARIIEVAKGYGKQVMYHCDGAIAPLIPELVDMGVDLLNPIQANAKDMKPERLKAEFGNRLSFHGSIDIVETLPHGTPADVQQEVRERVRVLGANGGYILSSTHHIQSDTPIENVLAMYKLDLRYRDSKLRG